MNKIFSKKKKIGLFSLIVSIFLIILISLAIVSDKKSLSIIEILISPSQDKISKFHQDYSTDESSIINLIITPTNLTKKIDFQSTTYEDPKFIEQFTYSLGGINGYDQKDFFLLEYKIFGITFSQNFLVNSLKRSPVDEVIYKGIKPKDIAVFEIKTIYLNFLRDLKLNDPTILTKYFIFSEFETRDYSELVQNIEFRDIMFKEESNLDVTNNLVEIGYLKIYLNNCNKEISLSLFYDINQEFWKLYSLPQFFELLCSPQFEKIGDVFIGKCEDCSLYPVNKTYGLRPDYVPNIIEFPNQPGVVIDQRILSDLTSMYLAAQNDGHAIIINSSYRSYSVQQNTFENWVQFEMAQGRDRLTAENIANSYSARAGFSEHQLGTTLDIATTQCPNFGKGCGPNENLWLWLKNNAYQYGFALSYPQDKEIITGYVYEPWHYRWVGVDLATEFKSIEATVSLQEFLFSKNMY